MTKKTSKPAQKRAELGGKILPRIGINEGEVLFRKIWPELRIDRRSSDILRMACPVHNEKVPSCDIDFMTGNIICYGCQFRTKNIFEFFKQSKGWSSKTTLDTLKQYVDLRSISESIGKEIEEIDHFQSATIFLMDAFNRHLVNLLNPSRPEIYTAPLLETCAPTIHWLFNHRKRNADLVSIMPYGVVPPERLVQYLLKELLENEVEKRQLKNQDYPERTWREAVFEQAYNLYRKMDMSFVHSVSYHCGLGFTTPGRIRIRRPSDDKHENITVLPGRTPDEPVGFFGLFQPRLIGRADLDTNNYKFFAVEGENDALSLMEGLENEGKVSAVILSVGGQSSGDLDLLAEAQIKELWLIGDDPNAGGTSFVKSKLKTAYEVDVRIFNDWDRVIKNYPTVKDPDDVVRTAGFKYAYDTFIREPKAYTLTSTWVYQQVQMDLVTKEIDPGNLRPVLDLVAMYGACVRHPAAQAAFVTAMAAETKIPEGEIRQSINHSKGTESAFKAQLLDCLKKDFVTLYATNSLRAPNLKLFHKSLKKIFDVPANDGEAIAFHLARVHGNFYNYIRDHVGIPSFLQKGDEDAPNSTPEKQIINDLYQYLQLSIQDLLRGVPLKTECQEFGQGGHYVQDPRLNEQVLYYQVGVKTYKGMYTTNSGCRVDWKELDGPIDENYLFKVNYNMDWSRDIRSVQDLISGNDITKENIFECITMLEDILQIGWKFMHPESDPRYMAYIIPAYVLSYVWPFHTVLAINGENSSGKSTLLSLLGGSFKPALKLLDNSASVDLFSEASVYQNYDRSSLLLCFDEFEEENDPTQRQSNAVTAIIRLMRNIIGEQGAIIDRGSVHGEDPIRYIIKTSMAFSSILKARKPEDNNRRMDIQTLRDEFRPEVMQLIFQKYTEDDFIKIRKTFALGLPKFAREYHEHFLQIRKLINTKDILPFKVLSRYIANYIPVCALMQMLERPWQEFLVTACKVREHALMTVSGETKASVLYQTIFRTPNIHPYSDSKMSTRITDHLRTQAQVDDLNRTRCGVAICYERQYAVIDWITVVAKGGLLESNGQYRGQSYRQLKDIFDQHADAMLTEHYLSQGVDRFVRGIGTPYTPNSFSVVNIKPLVEEMLKEDDSLGKPKVLKVVEGLKNDATDYGTQNL